MSINRQQLKIDIHIRLFPQNYSFYLQ